MKVLVTGAQGQLGYDVCKVLKMRNTEYKGVDIQDFDITNENETKDYITHYHPDAVVHCSAYTSVDKAEDNKDYCKRVNVDGTRYIARACKEINAKMIYISSDYVFHGNGDQFFEPDDPTEPCGFYGATKLGGEKAVQEILDQFFIVRISWVFGINGNNFVKTMLRLSESHEEVRVVNDQIGSPTYTADLAPLLCDMLLTDKYGIYHASNEGTCSWAQFAQKIFKIAKRTTIVIPILSSEYPSKALRPLNSRLSKEKLTLKGFKRLPSWEDALERYIAALNH